MKQIKKSIQRGLLDPDKDDPFELFISSTDIRYCYYKETHKILGNTFGMCVLQVRRRRPHGGPGDGDGRRREAHASVTLTGQSIACHDERAPGL